MEPIEMIRGIHIILGLVTITVMFLSRRENNKIMINARVILSAIMAVTGFLSGSMWIALTWAVITISLLYVDKLPKNK